VTAHWQTSLARKDLRALGPAWLASAALALIGATLQPGGAFAGCAAGTFLLAAMSIGHEYTGRTLPALLAQPVSRHQVLIVKMAVVVGLVAALGAVASLVDLAGLDRLWDSARGYATRRNAGAIRSLNIGPGTALLLPALAAACLAPWFTMVSRGPLGGLVFSVAIVGLTWLGGDLIGTFRFGLAPEDTVKVLAFRAQFAWWMTWFLSVAGAMLTWRAFVRLEASEGSPGRPTVRARRHVSETHVDRPTSSGGPWWWQVARKEIQLQKMIFVIAGLYIVFWCAIGWSARFQPALQVLLAPVSYLYAAAVALLLGSFASAEERQMGTLDWQVLMPVPAWKPWAVKVLVMCGLCLLLGFALPWALESTVWLPNDVGSVREAGAVIPMALIGMAIASLYVSSASKGGLRALLASLAAAVPVMAIGGGLLWLFNTTSRSAVPVLRESGWYRSGAFRAVQDVVDLKSSDRIAIIAGFVLAIALLRLALANHASVDRSRNRLWRQLGWIGASAVVCTFVMGSLQAATLDDWRVTGASGFRVRGHIKLEGSAPGTLHDRFRGSVNLVPATGWMGGGSGFFSRGLTFATTYAKPGRSFVWVETWGATPWALKSVVYQGRDISETTIDVATDLDDVVVTLSDQLGRIEVTVDDLERAWVFLFPADPALWLDPAVMHRRFSYETLTATSYATGVFAFDMPPDGEYLIVAADKYLALKGGLLLGGLGGGADADARRAAGLARIAPLADRIQARQGTTIKTRLTVRR
jgi:hypothetical protein